MYKEQNTLIGFKKLLSNWTPKCNCGFCVQCYIFNMLVIIQLLIYTYCMFISICNFSPQDVHGCSLSTLRFPVSLRFIIGEWSAGFRAGVS